MATSYTGVGYICGYTLWGYQSSVVLCRGHGLAIARQNGYSARSSLYCVEKSVGGVTQTTAHIVPILGTTGDING